MDNAKLNRWAELLLDTGKRNKLISFQDTKASTVEIVVPTPNALFDKIGGNTSFEVYDPKLLEEGIESQTADEADNGKESSGGIGRDKYIAMFSSKIKKASQVLLYNSFRNPIVALKNYSCKKNLNMRLYIQSMYITQPVRRR